MRLRSTLWYNTDPCRTGGEAPPRLLPPSFLTTLKANISSVCVCVWCLCSTSVCRVSNSSHLGIIGIGFCSSNQRASVIHPPVSHLKAHTPEKRNTHPADIKSEQPVPVQTRTLETHLVTQIPPRSLFTSQMMPRWAVVSLSPFCFPSSFCFSRLVVNMCDSCVHSWSLLRFHFTHLILLLPS